MNQETRILVIDDERTIRETLKISLHSAGFLTEEAATGAEGLTRASTFHPHLIILDLGLPDIGGLDVLRDLRKWTAVPVIVLTVNDDESAKVRLLDAGADDYLTKPFHSSELMARIRVAMRHSQAVEANPVFTSGDLEIDLNSRTVKVADRDAHLTATEFEFLRILVRARGKIVPQAQLLREVWGAMAVDQTHYLRVYCGQTRKKIEKDPSAPQHLLTEPGVGYRLV